MGLQLLNIRDGDVALQIAVDIDVGEVGVILMVDGGGLSKEAIVHAGDQLRAHQRNRDVGAAGEGVHSLMEDLLKLRRDFRGVGRLPAAHQAFRRGCAGKCAGEKGACEEKGEEFFHIGTSRMYFQVAPGAQQITRERTLYHDCCALSRVSNGRKWNSSYDTLYTPAVNLCNDFVKKAPGFVPGAENQIKECSDVLLSPEPPGGDHSSARESRPCAR